MKKLGVLIIFVAGLGLAAVKIAPFFLDEVEINKYDQNDSGTIEGIESVEISKEQVYQGNLLLVNNKYPVHQKGIKKDVVNLFAHKELTEGYGLLDSNVFLSKDVAHQFSEMIAAAENEGISHFSINSGFRDLDEQRVLYQQMGSDYALPAGYSEHNLGLSLDVGSTQMKMNEAPEGKWIAKNAWKYGFILRYPKDKTEVTGILFEPWHIRYVGFPHSAIMKEKNFALEEYLDYLKEEKGINAVIHGKKYTVSFYPMSKGITIKVPANHQYEISGDNIDGIIVTVY